MHLINRTLLTIAISGLTIVIVTTVIQYLWIKDSIESRVDNRLIKEKEYIKDQLKDIDPQEGFSYSTERTRVKILQKKKQNLRDSLFYFAENDLGGELVNYRVLRTNVLVEGQYFLVEIRKEAEETKTFIQSLIITFSVALISGIVLFMLLKYFILRNTWKPFFLTLEKLKLSDLQNQLAQFDTNVNVREFKQLNNELNVLAEKVYAEYQSQRIYLENVNHELMTPLSIIKGKLELIIQSENLDKQDLKLVSDIFDSIERITKVNRSLILLSKIDNNQFEEESEIIAQNVLDEVLSSFEDMIRSRELKIRKNYAHEFKITINETLGYILFSNLMKNAILHNHYKGGYITIEVLDRSISITNSGPEKPFSDQNIFDRFVKDSPSEDSIGLGLPIVQKICEVNNIEIEYHKEKNAHSFKILFT